MAEYTIIPGDSLTSIAHSYGMTWRDLYNRDENAGFREQHPDADLIRPGEKIWVPDPPPAETPGTARRIYLARTSGLERDHLNCIRSSYSVYLQIQLSVAKCLDAPDSFTLSDENGTYIRKLSLQDDVIEINGLAYLVFDSVIPTLKYQLTVDSPGVRRQKVFESVSYAELPRLRRRASWQAADFGAAANKVSFRDDSFRPTFSPQPIKVLGEGPYHVNRFRIYFRAARWILTSAPVPMESFSHRVEIIVAPSSCTALVKEFIRDFPLLFNGGREGILTNGIRSVSWMDVKGREYWKYNMAMVVRHQVSGPGGPTVLGFEIDIQPLRVIIQKMMREYAKAALSAAVGPLLSPAVDPIIDRVWPINMPEHPGTDPDGGVLGFRAELTNVHADWVGIDMVDESRGFAVQTLWRHERDWASQRLVDIIDYAAIPDSAKKILHRQEENNVELFNQFHFLSGRRSWVIRPASDPLAGDYSSTIDADVFFLETAAIERYSQAIHNELTSKDPGFAVEFREAVKTVWIRLLMNYVTANGFEVVPLDHNTNGWKKEAAVNYCELSFDEQAGTEAHPMTSEIVSLHPTLSEQLHD